jgi:hypothetical protein
MFKSNLLKLFSVGLLFFLLTGCGRLDKAIGGLPTDNTLLSLPPQNIRAFEGNKKVILVWDNPSDVEFNGVFVQRNELGVINNSSQAGMNSLSDMNNLENGFYLPPEGTAFPDNDLSNNQTYEYRVLAKNSAGNYSSVLVQTVTPRDSQDTVAPSMVSSIRAENISDKVFLNWENPLDNDFVGVVIVRKEDNYPETINDGVVVYVGENDGFTDDKVDLNKNYYYSIFSFDESLNFSDRANINISVGNSFQNEFSVNANTAGDQKTPGVSSLANGGFVVSALDKIAGDYNNIILNIFDNTGTKVVNDKKLILNNVSEKNIPEVADLGNNNFILTWESYDNVFAQIFNYQGTPQTGEFKVNGTSYEEHDQSDQVVASLGDGKFVIAWESKGWDGDKKGVVFKIFSFTNGVVSTIREEVLANQNRAEHQKDPAISVLDNGNFVLVWETKHRKDLTGGYDVAGRIFNSFGMPQTTEFWVNDSLEYYMNDQKWVHVDTLIDGSFVVVWASGKADADSPEDLRLDGIFSRRVYFNGSGVVFSSINKVNNSAFHELEYTWDDTEYELDFYRPQILGIQNGGYIVAWSNMDSLDGQGYSVRNQIFGPDNKKIGSEYQINITGRNDQKKPKLASLTNGDVIYVWQSDQLQDGNQNILARFESF